MVCNEAIICVAMDITNEESAEAVTSGYQISRHTCVYYTAGLV